MFKPVSLYIGLRYTKAKRRNRFISFISLASMIGIALGVAVLITVLSVMNGFNYQIKHKFFSIVPAVTVMTGENMTSKWQSLVNLAKKNPNVVAAAPYVNGKSMLSHDGQIAAISAFGIDAKQENTISKLHTKMVKGKLSSLTQGKYNIVIGQTLAANLGLSIGDKVTLFTPQTTMTPLGIIPTYRQFTVAGIYHLSAGFGYDSSVAFLNLIDAQSVFGNQATNGIHIKLKNIYAAPQVTQWLADHLSPAFSMTNWTQQFGAFFQALAMEKTMMFIILLLIVAVAVFNLVSTLVMVVNEKRADIAILRTLGATRTTILMTFVFQGALIGIIGTFIGLLAGLLLAVNAHAIADGLQSLFHVHFINSSVYFINFLPSRVEGRDLWHVCLIAFALSLLATIYPAYQASKTEPAKALRYE